MNISLYITVAVILGIVFLAIDFLIIRNKGQSSKLKAAIGTAFVRADEPGQFEYRIDLDLRAKSDVVLESIELMHGTAVIDPGKGINTFAIDTLSDIPEHGAPAADKDAFHAPASATSPVAGKTLAAGERHLTGAGRIATAEFMGGHWDWPLQGWTLTVKSSAGVITLPLVFSIHASNRADVFCQDYGSPASLIWSC